MANNFFNSYPQQQFAPQQQFFQPQVNNTVLVVPVQGESGANIYPVAAGNTVFLIDFATKTFWIKATDVNGIPSRFEAYEFKNKAVPVPQSTQENNFVSQSEFSEWKNQLDNQFQQIVASLNGLLDVREKQNVTNSTVIEKSAGVSAEVQRICEQLSKEQQRNVTTSDGAKSS